MNCRVEVETTKYPDLNPQVIGFGRENVVFRRIFHHSLGPLVNSHPQLIGILPKGFTSRLMRTQ